MIEIELFRKLIEKYRFNEYIAEDVQKYVVSSKLRVLKSSLRSVGVLSLFYSLVISFFFKSRSIRLNPSLLLSKIILFSTGVLISTSILASMILALNKFVFDKDTSINNNIQIENQIIDKKKDSGSIKNKLMREKPVMPDSEKMKRIGEEDSHYDISTKQIDSPERDSVSEKKMILSTSVRLGVANLVPSGIDINEAREITQTLYKNLKYYKNKKNSAMIYLSENKNNKSINRQLLGRISKVGKSHVIVIRVVDTQTGDILYSKTQVYNDPEARENVLENFASEINDKEEIWK